jgi:hypothetical protein
MGNRTGLERRRIQILLSVDFKCPLQESSKNNRENSLEAQIQREIGELKRGFPHTLSFMERGVTLAVSDLR